MRYKILTCLMQSFQNFEQDITVFSLGISAMLISQTPLILWCLLQSLSTVELGVNVFINFVITVLLLLLNPEILLCLYQSLNPWVGSQCLSACNSHFAHIICWNIDLGVNLFNLQIVCWIFESGVNILRLANTSSYARNSNIPIHSLFDS